ncbi:MAG: hypothetical protein JNL72_12015 [Flavipsychrobacter sp.]|nr:hypothetical protein [Flavipsychrobacter sp.]
MNITKLLLTAASVGLLATSCTPEKKGVQQYEYTYTNSTANDIRVDIYGSLEDYNNNRNLYMSGIATANGGTYVVPSSEFEANKQYYVDWYSSDYTYTNWQNRQGFYDEFSTGFIPTYQKNRNALQSVTDYARLVFLDGGNGTETRWVAVDGVAYPGGNTTEWADLPENYKYRKMTFRKDFSCTLYYKDDAGLFRNSKLTFRNPYQGTPQGMTQGMVFINVEDRHEVANVGIATYTIDNSTGTPTFGNAITLDMGDEGRYIMVRDTSSQN